MVVKFVDAMILQCNVGSSGAECSVNMATKLMRMVVISVLAMTHQCVSQSDVAWHVNTASKRIHMDVRSASAMIRPKAAVQ